VRLAVHTDEYDLMNVINFNSRLVRLAAMASRAMDSIEKFQFQIGAIGSQLLADLTTQENNFNSRLVRLAALLRVTPRGRIKFQFQIGAIGSVNKCQKLN